MSSLLTDWVLIRRAAFELHERLAEARVIDAGLLADGRIALVVRARAGTSTVAIDIFGSPPIVSIEEAEPAIAVEPGFIRKLATTLRGMILAGVSSRSGDRLLRLQFTSRSRFGVGDELELYVELTPRFGNVVLVKGGTIVTAAKEFSLAENPARAVLTGMPYVLPPLPHGVRPPRLLAEIPDDATLRGPLFVYRSGQDLVAAHVVALPDFAGTQCTRESSLLDVFAQWRAQRVRSNAHEGVERRRNGIVKRLTQRRRKLEAELDALAQKRKLAGARTELREEGDSIYGSLYQLPASEREAAKERAAKLFVRYKKLQASVPHIENRERAVATLLETVEALHWEAQRAGDEDVEDVESAVAALDPQQCRATARAPVRRRKRALLEFRTASGSRIVLGRSPTENADVTFRIARPEDLWFHAQGIPGAHVVLARDDRLPPPDEDVAAAASLAAFHSKAKASAKVPVDYTFRKYVRKQQNAPPGLVWYTHPKTILAEPLNADAFDGVISSR